MALEALGTDSFSSLGMTGSALAERRSILMFGPDFEWALRKSAEDGRGAHGGCYKTRGKQLS